MLVCVTIIVDPAKEGGLFKEQYSDKLLAVDLVNDGGLFKE